MGFVGISHRSLELLEIGPVDFDIRSSVCSLLFACGLGCVDGRWEIVLIGADCAVRLLLTSVSVVSVGLLVLRHISNVC